MGLQQDGCSRTAAVAGLGGVACTGGKLAWRCTGAALHNRLRIGWSLV